MTHPSAAEAEAQRGSGAAGAPGFGSGRWQGTVRPGLAWGQESGLKPQLGHSLAGRFPGRGDRCLPSRPGRRWAPERQGHRGCGWPRRGPQRTGSCPHPRSRGSGGSRRTGQLGRASEQRLRATQVGSPGERPRPDQVAHRDVRAVWRAEAAVEGRVLRPSLREGREWPAEEQRRATHRTGGQAEAWRGRGERREGAILWPSAMSLSGRPCEPLGISVPPPSLPPSDDGARGRSR